MRHVRKAVVPHHVLMERTCNFSVHDFVVVQLYRSLFKWAVAQLIECTADQDRWIVRWFGTTDAPRVEAKFLPPDILISHPRRCFIFYFFART